MVSIEQHVVCDLCPSQQRYEVQGCRLFLMERWESGEKSVCGCPKTLLPQNPPLLLGNRASCELWTAGRMRLSTNTKCTQFTPECTSMQSAARRRPIIVEWASVHARKHTPPHKQTSFGTITFCYISRTLLWPWKLTMYPVKSTILWTFCVCVCLCACVEKVKKVRKMDCYRKEFLSCWCTLSRYDCLGVWSHDGKSS